VYACVRACILRPRACAVFLLRLYKNHLPLTCRLETRLCMSARDVASVASDRRWKCACADAPSANESRLAAM
jgi:hypothetical protein